MENHIQLWEQCISIIKDNINSTAFNTWFTPIIPIKYENNEFLLQVPSTFFYEYIETHYAALMRFTLNKVVGEGTCLLYKITVDRNNTKSGSTVIPTSEDNVIQTKKETANPFSYITREDIDPRLNPTYNFNSYMVGSTNKLARNAGIEIAKEPGKSIFNPLFIYGKSGVGKTHLANAIGLSTKQLHPEKRVLYISANLFQIQFTDASKKGTINDFLLFYQSIDVLIIDDIQEFIGKTKTQNTFFNIFNHLHQMGKQLIMCSDREPQFLEGMEDRLITRFRSGLSAEIEKPDFDLRKSILNNKIFKDGLEISEDVVNYIAQNIDDNIRNIEGVLISLLAHSTLVDDEINLSLAKKIVGKLEHKSETKKITLEKIQTVVCEYFSIPLDALTSKSRERRITEPRQITMYLARTHTNIALASIGSAFGKKDHSTVLHAFKNVKNQMDIDKRFQETIHKLEEKIQNI